MTANIIRDKRFYVLLFILSGIFFRLYNLSWGSPFFFHPDERNIASSISQLSFPDKLNPHFFAYGSLPIYITYFAGVLINFFENLFSQSVKDLRIVSFENAILTGRVISSFLSIASLLLIYWSGMRFFGKTAGIISLLLASLSVGFIQYAHFSTFESWLTFFTLLLFYSLTLYALNNKFSHLLLSSVVLGILISIKISSLIYLPLCILIFFILDLKLFLKKKKKTFALFEQIILRLCMFAGITILMVNFTSPYFWIDNNAFITSLKYESDVALGTLRVFYTQAFENSIPILYQSNKVYPFILNPILAIVSVISISIAILFYIRNRDIKILLVLIFLIVTYLSQAFLFVKWIRYYIPTLPFIYLIFGIILAGFLKSKLFNKRIRVISVSFILLISFIYSVAYFKTVLYSPDTRIEASEWAKNNIKRDAPILSEVYDLGIVPFNRYFNSIVLHNFYDLETENNNSKELSDLLTNSEYIIFPSHRILETRLANPAVYPRGHAFYASVTNKYLKIYQTPCDIFCKILYLGSPQFSLEQTASVFDRPTVTIYKNVK